MSPAHPATSVYSKPAKRSPVIVRYGYIIYNNIYIYGGFLKWRYLEIIHFNKVSHYHPAIGVPPFMETPIQIHTGVGCLVTGDAGSINYVNQLNCWTLCAIKSPEMARNTSSPLCPWTYHPILQLCWTGSHTFVDPGTADHRRLNTARIPQTSQGVTGKWCAVPIFRPKSTGTTLINHHKSKWILFPTIHPLGSYSPIEKTHPKTGYPLVI